MRVAIVDYGSGNLRSAQKSFMRASIDGEIDARIELVRTPDEVARADKLVLPGVGAFGDCHNGIQAIDGMWQAIEEHCSIKARPFLGICVGMQLMATRGLEHGETKGFGWIKGDVTKIDVAGSGLKVPHMGWNTLDVAGNHELFGNVQTGADGQHAYFVHSYHLVAQDPSDVLATTQYGGTITAAVARDNMVGTQFHPEKSQILGLTFIRNFLNWTP